MNDVLQRSQKYWPALARDLAILTAPGDVIFDNGLDTVCEAYGIKRKDLEELFQVPYFKKLVDKATAAVERDGSLAGLKYRATALSAQLAETLYMRATEGQLESKESLKLLELLYKASGVGDKTPDIQVNTQVNVPVQVPQGIEKVAQYAVAAEPA